MDPVGLHKKGEVEINQILQSFYRLPNYSKAGAIATFIGVVREDPVEQTDDKVTHLEYEAYDDVALKRMHNIRTDVMKQFGVLEVSIHHIIDKLKVGEPSLFVAVLGAHRKESFLALYETVERVKKEVPIWKKEHTMLKAYWVSTEHPT